MIAIEELAYFIPDRRVAISDLRDELALTEKDVFLHTTYHGQKEVAYDPNISLEQLLQRALDQLIELPSLSNYKITHLLYTHTIGVNQAPLQPILPRLVQRYGWRECSAMAVTQANCASGLMALDYAQTLLDAAADDEAVIVLCGDRGIGGWRKQPGNTITGDAAAAALVTKNPNKTAVLNTFTKIDSRYWMGFYDPKVLEDFNVDHQKLLCEFLTESVNRSGYQLDDLKFLLPHNINKSSWKIAAKNAGIPNSKLYLDNVPKFGHCFTSDNFLNFGTARDEKKLADDDLCLMVSLGSGFYYASALLQYRA